MDRAQAQKELIEILEASLDGPTFTMEEVEAHIAELLAPKNNVYLTGDVHGRFDRVVEFCVSREVEAENTFILLGDAGLNYYGDGRDTLNKEWLSELPITFFCIHGNHEMRPSPTLGYELREYHGGQVWVQPAYPNIVFAVDGEIYDFCGHSCLVIGGAYSVDKYYRLAHGWGWWDDEQPSDAIKAKVERVLSERDWKIDIVLSHTCPLRYEPVEVFLPGIDQSTVDKSTEQWLGEIESRLHYERWYCAHYHTEKQIDKIRFLFNDYAMIPNTLSIEEEQAIRRRRAHEAELIQASGLLDDLETTDDTP
jgi:hypothetical protein